MTTATLMVSALDEARRGALLSVEGDLAHGMGPCRLEDATALKLPEMHGSSRPDRLWLEISHSGAVLRRLGEEPIAKWSAARVIADVLALRAEDPQAAHSRDLQRAERLVTHWRSCFDSACCLLAERGATVPWNHPEGTPFYGIAPDSYSPLCPLHDREQYSWLLARALSAQTRLIAAGPFWPEQTSLF